MEILLLSMNGILCDKCSVLISPKHKTIIIIKTKLVKILLRGINEILIQDG